MSFNDYGYNPGTIPSDDGGIGNPGPPTPDTSSDFGDYTPAGGIGSPGPPPQDAGPRESDYSDYSPPGMLGNAGFPSQDTSSHDDYSDTTTKRAQQSIDGGIGNAGPPADSLPTPAGTDNRSWWDRAKDLGSSALHEVGDLALMGPRALKETVDAGNNPLTDPGAFLKDAYGSAAGTVGNTVKDAFDVGSRIQGSAAITANDLKQGNWGQLASDLNPASNAYYAVTGDQAPWMADDEYNTRNVVSRNPAAAILPGSGGSGEGPQVVPDGVPVIGGDSLYDLPVIGGIARAEEAVRGSLTGNAAAQGPSLDIGGLRDDLANGMPLAQAMEKYQGSAGAQIVSDLLNPANFVEVPGVAEAVGALFETRTARALDEIAARTERAGAWTPEAAAETRRALTARGPIFDLSAPNTVNRATEIQADALSGLNRVSTAQETAAVLYDGAARIARGDAATAGQWAAQYADRIGGTADGVLDTMRRIADGARANLEARGGAAPERVAALLDAKAEGIRALGDDLGNVELRQSAARLGVDLDRIRQQGLSADPAVAQRGVQGRQAAAALAARDIAKSDLRAGWYAEAGVKLPGTESQFTQGMQGLFSVLRGLMLAGSAPPLALQKFTDEWFRAMTQGTLAIRLSDTATAQAVARFAEKRNALGMGGRAQGFLDRSTVGNLVRNDVLPPTAALRDVNPLTARSAFTGRNRYGEAITPGARVQALASPVDRWNQALIAAPTQHVVLNALYQDTKNLTGSAEMAARRVAAAMRQAGYSPAEVQRAYERARAATNPGDILNIGSGLPPVVPDRGMAQGRPSSPARGQNITPPVLQAIQETGGQPGLLREVARPPEYTPAQMARSANANERRAWQWAEDFDRAGPQAGVPAIDDSRPVPSDVLQTANRMGIDTQQTAGQLADELTARRTAGRDLGSAGAGTSQPLTGDARRDLASALSHSSDPDAVMNIRLRVDRASGGDYLTPLDEIAEEHGHTLSAPSPVIGGDPNLISIDAYRVPHAPESGVRPNYEDAPAATPPADSMPTPAELEDLARSLQAGRGYVLTGQLLDAARGQGYHVTSEEAQAAIRRILDRNAGGDLAAGGGGGAGYRALTRTQEGTMRRFGLQEPGDLTALEAGMGGQFDRTRFFKGQREGATDAMVDAYRAGRPNPDRVIAQARERFNAAYASADIDAMQRVEERLLDHAQAAAVAKNAAAKDALTAARVEMFGPATRDPQARAAQWQAVREQAAKTEAMRPRTAAEMRAAGNVPPAGAAPPIRTTPAAKGIIDRGMADQIEGTGQYEAYRAAQAAEAAPAGAAETGIGRAGAPPIGREGAPIPLAPPRDVQALEAARGRAQAGIRDAAFARGTGDQAAVNAGLERGYRIVGNNADQTTAGAWMKNGIGGVTPPVLPFAPFHIHSAQFWAEYFAAHPALALGMAQVLSNFDDYGTLHLAGGSTLAGLVKMTTGLHVLEWAQKAYEYARDVHGAGGNNALQQIGKNVNYDLFGNNAFVRPFEYVSGPVASATQRGTNPLLDAHKVDYETKRPLVGPRDQLREYGSMNGTTGVGQRLNDLAGGPVPRNVVSGLTNPGQALGNQLQRGTDALFGVDRTPYNPDPAAAHALGFVADRLGLSKYQAEKAYYSPATPQEIALGKQLHDAVNVRLDTQAMGKIAPVQANAAPSPLEGKGVYAPKDAKGYMLDMPIGAGGFTGKDLLNQPGNYYDTLDKIAAAKQQYGANSPQARALEGELATVRARDVAQAPGALGPYFDALHTEGVAKYGDTSFRGTLNAKEQLAYDAFNDLKASPDYKARTALEGEAAKANAGKDAPKGSPQHNAYTEFYRQHGDDLTRLNNIVNGAEQSIVDRYGVNPKELSNRASVAAGYAPVYGDTTIRGQQPIGQAGAPSASSNTATATSGTNNRNASSPRGNAGAGSRPSTSPSRNSTQASGSGRAGGSASSQQAGNDFFDFYRTLTDKGERAAVLKALDRDGVNPIGQKGVTAAEFTRALDVAKRALSTERLFGSGNGSAKGGNSMPGSARTGTPALSLAELSALMERATGIGPAAADRALLGGGGLPTTASAPRAAASVGGGLPTSKNDVPPGFFRGRDGRLHPSKFAA